MIDADFLSGRTAGVLLHPTSLPGPYGIGDLGPEAHAWLDTLSAHNQRFWQLLPLGPTGYGNSPYQSFSAFAGNPLLISPELLTEDGLFPASELDRLRLPPGPVCYEKVAALKRNLLERALHEFRSRPKARPLRVDFDEFVQSAGSWLEDFALFMAIKSAGNNSWWVEWEPDLAMRKADALDRARRALEDEIDLVRFEQFLFFRQWGSVRDHAHGRGISLIGDLPIFVAADSADVWSHPELFDLDRNGRPRSVAGVPPDYFSATGQRWGNPLYRWSVLKDGGYRWWLDRISAALERTDVLRLDHFRGFAAFWEVPAACADASAGRWAAGPGADFFRALDSRMGRVPLIAEDLGWITEDVEELRLQFGFPGMRVLQFAFAGAVEPRFLPYRYDRKTVAYTGTHDNDTTRGWYEHATPEEQRFTRSYLDSDGTRIHRDMVRLAWSTVANLAIAPLQDLLGLGSEARMNTPGTAEGNWEWRAVESQITPEAFGELGEITRMFGRDEGEARPDPES